MVAISAGVSLLQFGAFSSTAAQPETAQLAVADRNADDRANRGGVRTSDGAGVAAAAPGVALDLTAQNEEATSVAEETTTTTAAPTTTTAKPRPTTTKPKPAVTRPPAPPQAVPPSVGDDAVWVRLAKCEAGGRNDLGAPYYGYFQFSAQTWRGVGGTGLPSDHSWDVQLAMAKKLQARSGWGQWPVCGPRAVRG